MEAGPVLGDHYHTCTLCLLHQELLQEMLCPRINESTILFHVQNPGLLTVTSQGRVQSHREELQVSECPNNLLQL